MLNTLGGHIKYDYDALLPSELLFELLVVFVTACFNHFNSCADTI